MDKQEMDKSVVQVASELNGGLGHDGKHWPATTDASVWATEFCKLNTATDWGTMVGWFANAIEIGRDTERWKHEAGERERMGAA